MWKLFLPFFCLFSFISNAAVRINEVLQCNINGVIDDFNLYPDGWVELYNDSAASVNLNDYSICNENDSEKAYALPDVTIAPNGYLLVYCDKRDEDLHTDFYLGTYEASSLYLFKNGMVVDSLNFPAMLAHNTSYGRVGEGWAFLREATPYAKNGSLSVSEVMGTPTFSVLGGVMTDKVELKLSLPDGVPADACIMYTTDSSTPTEKNGKRYEKPINLSETVAIRAVCCSENRVSSPVVTQTYIFLKRQQTLPIISLVTDDAYFFNPEIGIYTQGVYADKHPDAEPEVAGMGAANYFFKWDRPLNFEYFTTDSRNAVINQLCETRISGNSSRHLPIKALVLMTNKDFGNKYFAYPFFSDKPWIDKFKSVTLRSASQDARMTYMRDAFAHQSFKHTSIDYQAYQPAIMFYNGQYWGIRNIRERDNDDYLRSNHTDLDDLDYIEGFYGLLKKGDLNDFNLLKSTYSDSLSTYEQLDSLMDINEFLDYFILYSLYCNTDFPGNNVLMWKPKEEGAKWRWIAKDFDVSMGVVDSPYNLSYLNYVTRTAPFLDRGLFNSEDQCRLFKKLLSFPRFRDAYIDRASVYMGTFASAQKLTGLLDSLAANIAYEMPFFQQRTESDSNMDLWESSLNQLKNWIENRIPFFYSDMASFFQLGKDVPLVVDAGDKVYFNNQALPKEGFDGRYYENRLISLRSNVVDYVSDVPSKPYAYSVCRVDDERSESELYGNDGLADAVWVAQYVKGDSLYTECYASEDLNWSIPKGVNNARLSKKANGKKEVNANGLSFVVYDFTGRIIADGKYEDVMPVLKENKTYILNSYRNGSLDRKWKVRRL